jgi:glycosyltransferase involved in cell wall biosynthesis
VSLVIKAFPNPHNRITEQIADARTRFPGLAPVILTESDLTYGQLRRLYSECRALVVPSRGEGFGLPMAEAMLLDVPVITTAFGGQRDFCTPETAWLIDYDLQPSRSHLTDGEALWAEPRVEHLAALMREVYHASPRALRARTEAAKDLIRREYTWASAAARARHVIDRVRYTDTPSDPRLRIGWVSTWKEKCGIASYSESLVRHLPADGLEIALFTRQGTSGPGGAWRSTQCWRDRQDKTLAELKQAVLGSSVDSLVVQFNFGFFDVKALANLGRELEALGIPVIIAFHATADVERDDLRLSLREGLDGLDQVSALLVHSRADLKRLYDFGFTRNVILFPHGAPFRPETSIAAARRRLGIAEEPSIIASYGFMLPPKGLLELVQAFGAVRVKRSDAILFLVNSLYPSPESREIAHELRDQIRQLGLEPWIRLFDDYLPDEHSLALLECASIVVFPHQHSTESSSAAVRFGLSANRPVLCTPLAIFDDVRPAIDVSEDTSSAALARAILAILDDDAAAYRRRVDRQRDWLMKHSWETAAKRMRMLITAAVQQARFEGRRFH